MFPVLANNRARLPVRSVALLEQEIRLPEMRALVLEGLPPKK
jgi:hypothetical protein